MSTAGTASGFSNSGPSPGREGKPAPRDDKPCSRCGHVRTAHAPAESTRMHCNADGCQCAGYFPINYEEVVRENIALRQLVNELRTLLSKTSASLPDGAG